MADTALVLGGGGTLGGAWEIGVLAGLAAAGVDPTGTDTVIGTSAGAVLGARLTSGVHPAELLAGELAGTPAVAVRVTAAQTARYLWAALATRDPERSVRRLGRAALASRTVPETEVLAVVDTLLDGVREWPDRDLRLASIDAHTGALAVFDASSGVPLPRAVAASSAVPVLWPPVSVAGRRWMDGGTRSTTNVHLARGHRRVLALSPVPRAVGPHPHAVTQGAELAAEGAEVLVLTPDADARRVIGRNLLDHSRRAAVAEAGRRQGAACAGAVAALLGR
ncbi:patatin-like phospholipase family protein [Kitasatospora sp. DSM 101779]|uniref:patatin-like phospholipase family protein n=1 Tax=Kitasatospora sp. DSM 101779 TaxID=2853165 RepID=UPI0021D822F9|nr:patatin-like phospholipase family protein [Kitasatospora sp. DSM 101779]MCU7820617.1 patatin-like phospholipase family protein [Kitasatospora sp. DSM 101779]